ncbi:MAG: hypothetical protein Q8Q94_03705 [bacterium]|nr:hypothetical protein [bacterium]MDZ4299923.1 hypothetical protein [Candidatus Sungbacteria bacterium]
MPKKITIETLAEMIRRGFHETATKSELEELRKHGDENFRLLADDIRLVKEDVHDMKITLGPLVRTVVQMEHELQNFHLRLSRLERKTGIAK